MFQFTFQRTIIRINLIALLNCQGYSFILLIKGHPPPLNHAFSSIKDSVLKSPQVYTEVLDFVTRFSSYFYLFVFQSLPLNQEHFEEEKITIFLHSKT